MSKAKKLFAAALLFLLVGPMLGCGVGTTWEDNSRRFRRVAEYDARMMVDDLKLFAQTDRPLRTSRYVID